MGILEYNWHDADKKTLANIELKAARLIQMQQLANAKKTPNNVDAQIQALLNVANTGVPQ